MVDGDTFRVLAPPDRPGGYRLEAFRIRLYSVNTPEKPLQRGSDESLRRAGVDPHADNLGRQASMFVKGLCENRALFIEPEEGSEGGITDRYGRLLANVCLSGARGPRFDTEGAFSLGPYLIRRGFAATMRGKEVPPDVPYLIWQLNRKQKEQCGPGPSL